MRYPRLSPIFRRLLEMDKPVPSRTEAEFAAERDRNYRWNFGVNLLDVANFWFGMSFISATTIVPLFISKLTDSPIPIGLAAVIAQGAWYLPQLFTANFVERLPWKKPVVANLGFFLERLPLWIIVLSAIVAIRSPGLGLILFLLAYAWHGLGAGLVATAWQDLIARCFPVARRGRFLGLSFFVGALTGAAAAGFSARLLDSYPFPTNFIYCFGIAATTITISWIFLYLTREPAQTISAPRQSTRQYWTDLPNLLRHDINFAHFMVARVFLALSGLGIGFVTVYAVKRWSVPDSTVGGYTAAFLLGQTFANLLVGILTDKYGHKLSLEISALTTLLAFVLAWLAPDPQWIFAVFFLLGMRAGTVLVSGILVIFEFCAPEKRPTYSGLTNTIAGVVNIIGPLVGAGLAIAGYDWPFILSAIFGLLALVTMRWWVQEPRFARIQTSEG
jgi:MFS family permease